MLSSKGIADNTLSYVDVQGSCKVRLYSDDNLQGLAVELDTRTIPGLNAHSAAGVTCTGTSPHYTFPNNRMSSLEIIELPCLESCPPDTYLNDTKGQSFPAMHRYGFLNGHVFVESFHSTFCLL